MYWLIVLLEVLVGIWIIVNWGLLGALAVVLVVVATHLLFNAKSNQAKHKR